MRLVRVAASKVGWISAFFAGLAGFLAGLWLIAYASPLFVWLFLASFAAALASLLVMSASVLWEIWLARPAGGPSTAPAADGVEACERNR